MQHYAFERTVNKNLDKHHNQWLLQRSQKSQSFSNVLSPKHPLKPQSDNPLSTDSRVKDHLQDSVTKSLIGTEVPMIGGIFSPNMVSKSALSKAPSIASYKEPSPDKKVIKSFVKNG